MCVVDPYGNRYPKGVHSNPNVIYNRRLLTQSFAISINEKRDLAIKIRSQRLEI
jgi:hypothetical protein